MKTTERKGFNLFKKFSPEYATILCSSYFILCYVILFYFVSFTPDLLKDFENNKKWILPKDTAYLWKRNEKYKKEKGCGLAYESN
jgi:hypothetical protein